MKQNLSQREGHVFQNQLLRVINYIFNAWADYGFGRGDREIFCEIPYNFYRILSEINSIYIAAKCPLHFF